MSKPPSLRLISSSLFDNSTTDHRFVSLPPCEHRRSNRPAISTVASPLKPSTPPSRLSPHGNEWAMVVFGSPTDNVLERDKNFKVLKDLEKELEGAWNYGLEIVEQKKDGQILMKKKVIPNTFDRQLTATSMSISRPLYHPNICRVVDSYFASDMWRVYTELCDLGNLEYFLQRGKKGETRGKFPGVSYWHLVKSLVEAFCYLTYGYDTINEVLANDGEKAGWDSVIHDDVSASNVFVKSASPGEYPIIKLGDFDRCSSRTQFQTMYDPPGDPASEFRKFQQSDLRALRVVLKVEVLPDRDVGSRPEIKAIYKMVTSWSVGGELMARSLKETIENEKVSLDVPFPTELLVPHELFVDALAGTKTLGGRTRTKTPKGWNTVTKTGKETNGERDDDDSDLKKGDEIPGEDEDEDDDEEEKKYSKSKGKRKRTGDEDKDWEEDDPYSVEHFVDAPDITDTSPKRRPKRSKRT